MQTDKTECVRCGSELEDGDGDTKYGANYCECCYDDLFVSWNDVLGGKDDTKTTNP